MLRFSDLIFAIARSTSLISGLSPLSFFFCFRLNTRFSFMWLIPSPTAFFNLLIKLMRWSHHWWIHVRYTTNTSVVYNIPQHRKRTHLFQIRQQLYPSSNHSLSNPHSSPKRTQKNPDCSHSRYSTTPNRHERAGKHTRERGTTNIHSFNIKKL